MRTLLILTLSCAPASGAPMFENATDGRVPPLLTGHKTMDAEFADLDGDGDLDLVLALEWVPNVVLYNDGTGAFPAADAVTLGVANGDSEDVAIADFNGDGRLDLAFANEDTATNELFLQNENGSFTDASQRFPVKPKSNAVLAHDLTGDGLVDVLFGNNGQNTLLVATRDGGFVDETAQRLPALSDVTQDVELGDVDNDGDLDLLVANEGANRLLINDGNGRFTDAELPMRASKEETREGDFGDIDNDGDLDVVFANVGWHQGTDPRNRVLVNDGAGSFTDETTDRLPTLPLTTVDVDLVDIDNDGDLDWISAEMGTGGPTIFLNNGAGVFDYAPEHPAPKAAYGPGVDVELADLNGDGRPDLYLAHFGPPDMLLFSITDNE